MFEMFENLEAEQQAPNTLKQPPAERSKNCNLVGLKNLGTTCYLNSLLQLLYMTHEFRSKLYELDDDELGIKEFEKELNSATGEVDKKQEENEMDMIPEEFLTDEEKEQRKKRQQKVTYRRIPLRLRELFANLQLANQSAISTEKLTASFGWTNNDIGVQHDISELNKVLFDALHRSLKGITNGDQLIPSLYSGATVNQLLCLGCGNIREREEEFQDIMLQVEGIDNIISSLYSYVAIERLREDNRYECDHCTVINQKGKQDANMAVGFRKLPKVLVFTLTRFGFDWAKDTRFKINSQFKFPLVLDMAPFTEENIRKTLNLSTDESPNKQKNESSNSDNTGRQDKKSKKPKLMENEIDENSSELYDLVGVVIHSGVAHGGHYYAYIKDRLNEGNWEEKETKLENHKPGDGMDGHWYEFNDSSVRQIEIEEIAKEYGGNRHCAYMLIYIRKEPQNQSISIPQVPKSLENQVTQANQELVEHRELWRKENAKIEFKIYTKNQFNLVNNKFYPIYLEEPEEQNGSAPPASNTNDKIENLDIPVNEFPSDDVFSDLFGGTDDYSAPISSTSQSKALHSTIIKFDRYRPLSDLLMLIVAEIGEKEYPGMELDRLRIDKIKVPDQNKTNQEAVKLDEVLRNITTEEQWSTTKTIDDMWFYNNDNFICWFGDELPPPAIFNIQIIYFLPSESPAEDEKIRFNVKIGEVATIKELKEKIENELELVSEQHSDRKVERLKVDEQMLSITNYYQCKLLNNQDFRKLSDVISVSESIEINLEKLKYEKKKPLSRAIEQFEKLQNSLYIEMINQLVPNTSSESFFIECSRENTVEELRQLIFSYLTSSSESKISDINDIQIHFATSVNGQYQSGGILDNGKRSLLSYSITNESKLILKTYSSDIIEIKFKYNLLGEEDKIENDPYHLLIPSQSTISELTASFKKFIKAEKKKNFDNKYFQIVKLNFNGNEEKIFSDSLTLIEAGLDAYHDFLILFNEFKFVDPNLFPVYVHVIHFNHPEPNGTLHVLDCETILQQFIQFYPTTLIDDREEVEENLRRLSVFSPTYLNFKSTQYAEFLFSRIFVHKYLDILMSKDRTLGDLKQEIFNLYCQSPSDPPVHPLNNINQLRLWIGGRLLFKDTSTLKKNGISSPAALTVEILPENSNRIISNVNQTLLFIHSLEITSTENYEWRYHGEFVFESNTPTTKVLFDQLSKFINSTGSADSVTGESFMVFKYFYNYRRFEEIKFTPPTGGTNFNKGGKKGRNKNQQNVDNVRKNKSLLSSGDVLLLIDMSKLPGSVVIDDLLVQLLLDNRIPHKPVRKSNDESEFAEEHYIGRASTSVATNRREERAITINIGNVEGLDDY